MGCTIASEHPGGNMHPMTLSLLYKPVPQQTARKSLLQTLEEEKAAEDDEKLALETMPSQRLRKPELWASYAVDVPDPWGPIVSEKLTKVQALYNMRSGWDVHKKMKEYMDINIQSMEVENTDWHIVRSDGVINENALTILSVLMNYKLRGQYDSTWETGGVVKKLQKDTRITYLKTKRKRFIVRDMVLLSHEVFLKDETLVSLSFSVETDKCPLVKGVARTLCNFQCWILRPLRDTANATLHKTHATLITHIDPRGPVGQFGKKYWYNLFGVKPMQSLRSYLHRAQNANGYLQIRHSMYNFYTRQTPEETIHDDSGDETTASEGFYDKVKNLHPKTDSSSVSKLIDRRLRYHGVKNPPPPSPESKQRRDERRRQREAEREKRRKQRRPDESSPPVLPTPPPQANVRGGSPQVPDESEPARTAVAADYPPIQHRDLDDLEFENEPQHIDVPALEISPPALDLDSQTNVPPPVTTTTSPFTVPVALPNGSHRKSGSLITGDSSMGETTPGSSMQNLAFYSKPKPAIPVTAQAVVPKAPARATSNQPKERPGRGQKRLSGLMNLLSGGVKRRGRQSSSPVKKAQGPNHATTIHL